MESVGDADDSHPLSPLTLALREGGSSFCLKGNGGLGKVNEFSCRD